MLSGLSPRPRGSLRQGLSVQFGLGSIPASAGKPNQPVSEDHHQGVYPRVRGEAIQGSHSIQVNTGLSPRPRGSLQHPEVQWHWRGSIPASAGKPRLHPHLPKRYGVYPRVRGEAINPELLGEDDQGLSPRPRGSRRVNSRVLTLIGSIPASAGKPSTTGGSAQESRVYPRVRGEAQHHGRFRTRVEGLSPRPRGSPLGRRG